MEVGVRELRDRLSHYLSVVRDGQEVTVTDHGKAVAVLVPLDQTFANTATCHRQGHRQRPRGRAAAVIAYFDTSAVIPLVVGEPSSTICTRLWNEATHSMSARLLYPEARAALARAERKGRITKRQHNAAVAELEAIITEIDHVEITEDLARYAGELAHAHQLRGYDAVHLAAAIAALDAELVLVTGDHDLANAARSLGVSVALTL